MQLKTGQGWERCAEKRQAVREADSGHPARQAEPISADISGGKEVIYREELFFSPPILELEPLESA